jgi:hypothetical protein
MSSGASRGTPCSPALTGPPAARHGWWRESWRRPRIRAAGRSCPEAAVGGAGEDRGVREMEASPQGCRVVRRRLSDLAGHHEGCHARPGSVREAHVPHLSQAGLWSRSSSLVLLNDSC